MLLSPLQSFWHILLRTRAYLLIAFTSVYHRTVWTDVAIVVVVIGVTYTSVFASCGEATHERGVRFQRSFSGNNSINEKEDTPLRYKHLTTLKPIIDEMNNALLLISATSMILDSICIFNNCEVILTKREHMYSFF